MRASPLASTLASLVFVPFTGLDLGGKPVACFGVGDSANYGDYYCDAMEEIYQIFR